MRTSTMYFKTAGITPAAPFVGDVTILPPLALTSFTFDIFSCLDSDAKVRCAHRDSIAGQKVHGRYHRLPLSVATSVNIVWHRLDERTGGMGRTGCPSDPTTRVLRAGSDCPRRAFPMLL